MRFLSTTTILLALLAAGCAADGTDGGNNLAPGGGITGPSSVTPPRQTTALLAFSTTASQGWSSIDVHVDGLYVGTLRRYIPSSSSASSCVASFEARVVATVAAGSHTYTARSNNGAQWSGSTTVSDDSCREIVLTCPNGDCR
jgi:hypothetical protein